MRLSRGFTIVEILTTMAIISILGSIVFVSVISARAKGRDTQRLNDLSQLQTSLRLYAEKRGTFAVAGTGEGNNGSGWVAYEGGTYSKSIVRGLVEEGILPQLLSDPQVPHGQSSLGNAKQYMHYFIGGLPRNGSCLFAKMERPTSTAQTTAFNTAATLTGSAAPATEGMNFALCTDMR